MASFFSHPAFPVALGLTTKVPKRLLVLCIVLTCMPDADVIAFKYGIPYESQWGHRGFTHSIVFALATGGLCSFMSKGLKVSKNTAFWWTFTSTLSHSVFDALTNGGLGVAFFWPFDHARYFFPWRPVKVSPIGVRNFLGLKGIMVVMSEIIWIWLPCLILGLGGRFFRGRKSLP